MVYDSIWWVERDQAPRSNPDDPPDLELIFASRTVGLEHTSLKLHPLGHSEAIAATIKPGGGRTIPSISKQWSRHELEKLAVGIGSSWAKTSDEHLVAFDACSSRLEGR